MSTHASAPRSSRRQVLQSGALGFLGGQLSWQWGSPAVRAGIALDAAPDVPLEVGHDPQFLFDLHVVDCTWGLHEKQEPVKRVFHAAKKHGDGPLLTGDQPSHFAVVRDDGGRFHMWYQLNHRLEFPEGRKKGQAAYRTYVGYAQSADGIDWQRPDLGLFPDAADGSLPKNCVLYRPDSPESYFHAPQILEAPERDRRGYRYLMVYLGGGPNAAYRGIRLVGSHDGVHWDLEHEQLIAPIGSDHHNTIVYDAHRDEYVLYLRAKHIYLAPGRRGGYDTIEEGEAGVRLNTGQSRRGVARMASKTLWAEWSGGAPQTILVPDETDADNGYNYFYGLPTRYHAGVYFGFLQSFRMNDYMHGELAFSRDGIRFDRLPWRPKIVEYGPEGAWDSVMILASPFWIEMGDEWWIYYNGWDGPHGTPERTGGIGLANLRKEGFVSLRGPAGGGVVCTREIRWPGGDLLVNADASKGELRIRVSDALRVPHEGYDYQDGPVFTGDAVAHAVKWNGRSLDSLKGEVVRLEFFLKNADLYTFRAVTT